MNTLNVQNKRCVVAIGLFLCALPGVAQSADTTATDHRAAPRGGHEHEGFDADRYWQGDHLLGDPAGLRSELEEQGILVEASLIADLSKNVSGGASKAGTFRHLFDLGVKLDLEALLGVEGGKVFIDFQTKEGQDGSAETGDLQGYANIDAPDYTALYEVWYEQMLFGDIARIKLGKIDANADFGYTEFGGEFIHSSPGLSPTAFVMPQYPDPAFGALAFVGEEDGGFYVGAGIFDGASQEGVATGTRGPSTLFGDPADLFMVGEAGYRWDAASVLGLPGRAAAGAWHHTGGFATFAGGTDSHTTGFYFVLDQLLHKENTDESDVQGVGLFAQYGWADPDVNAIEHHLGLGVQWVGALPGRDDDVVGLMMSWARLSDEPGAGFTADAETAVELFYKWQLTNFFSVKPVVQYIANPGGAGLDDAWVTTLRAELVF